MAGVWPTRRRQAPKLSRIDIVNVFSPGIPIMDLTIALDGLLHINSNSFLRPFIPDSRLELHSLACAIVERFDVRVRKARHLFEIEMEYFAVSNSLHSAGQFT